MHDSYSFEKLSTDTDASMRRSKIIAEVSSKIYHVVMTKLNIFFKGFLKNKKKILTSTTEEKGLERNDISIIKNSLDSKQQVCINRKVVKYQKGGRFKKGTFYPRKTYYRVKAVNRRCVL